MYSITNKHVIVLLRLFRDNLYNTREMYKRERISWVVYRHDD